MKSCSICKRTVDTENAPILAMGGFGNPRYLCEECSADIESALYEKDTEKIEASMQRLSEKLAAASSDDGLTIETVKDIFSRAGERAKAIKDGAYDFSEDESADEGFDELPQELMETEEDKEKDKKDAETAKKIDKISNWITLGIIVAAVIFFVVKLII